MAQWIRRRLPKAKIAGSNPARGWGMPQPLLGKLYFFSLLSICQLHTTSGCGKREAHINWSMVTCKMAAPVTGTTLRTTGPVPAESRQ